MLIDIISPASQGHANIRYRPHTNLQLQTATEYHFWKYFHLKKLLCKMNITSSKSFSAFILRGDAV